MLTDVVPVLPPDPARITIRNTRERGVMRTISLRLDTEADAMLRALCERLNATQTEVVRRALEQLAGSATPTAGALGVELGLVGAFASGDRGNAADHSKVIKARLIARRRDEQRHELASATDSPPGVERKRPNSRPRRPKS